MTRVGAYAAALACVVALVSGCGGEDRSAVRTRSPGPPLQGDFSGSGPGTLLAAEALYYLPPELRAGTSLAARITYASTSGVNDSHTSVTGTVFVPLGAPPRGGWRIVALGHPVTGIDPGCAPSDSPTLLGAVPDVLALVAAGYMVVMTDYQGLGLPVHAPDGSTQDFNAYHPFLDSATVGYNVIDSVRAARKLVPAASGEFAIWGRGQGGQAAWAADELAPDYRGDLNLVGVIADGPTAALEWLADAASAGALSQDQELLLQQFLAALKKTYAAFDLDAYRHGAAKENWDAFSACWGATAAERSRIAAQLGPDDLRPTSADATEILRGYLKKTSLPQAPAAAPMLIVPARDGLIPQDKTDAAVLRACMWGDVIQFGGPQDGEPARAIYWINERFNHVPVPNDCARIEKTTSAQPGTAPEPAG